MNQKEAREYFSKQRFGLSKQDKLDRKVSTMRDARKKHLYNNPHAPIPDAKARIAEAIAQLEQTLRNLDALTEGEMK
jgi:hypothetical protein